MFVLFLCLIRPFFESGVSLTLVKEIHYRRKSLRVSLERKKEVGGQLWREIPMVRVWKVIGKQ